MRSHHSVRGRRAPGGRLALVVAMIVLGQAWLTAASALATPGEPVGSWSIGRHDLPEWLSAETASNLDLGFDVLLPPFVPAPFGGEPSVDARDGFYQLYWLVPGAPPTYLLITGEVGGVIPDYSFFDRNVELVINADVQGTPAYHDLTPIYDRVYWQVGDVVYTVDSNNLSETDSLSIANALISLGPIDGPAEPTESADDGDDTVAASLTVPETAAPGEVVSIRIDGVADATLTADAGTFVASGEAVLAGVGAGGYDWQAPESDEDLTVVFVLTDSTTGETLATSLTFVQSQPSVVDPSIASLICPGEASLGRTTRVVVTGSGQLTVDASDGVFPAEAPNTDFAPDADGGDVVFGAMPAGGVVELAWLAPEAPMTAYLFLLDPEGTVVAECGVEVIEGETTDEVDLPAPAPAPSTLGDGTDFADRFDDVVATVVAWRRPTSGDETGGPNESGSSVRATSTDGEEAARVVSTPTPAAPTPEPTATLAPTNLADGMVALVIGPEGGELACPAGATVSFPPGALDGPSTVTIQPIASSRLPTSAKVTLIPGAAFDVTIAEADGASVEKLNKPARFTIAPTGVDLPPEAVIYRVAGTRFETVKGVTRDGNSLSVPLERFSRYVVGVPAATAESSRRDPMPLVLGAIGFVLLLMTVVTVGGFVLRRRPRSVVPRRATLHRSRVR